MSDKPAGTRTGNLGLQHLRHNRRTNNERVEMVSGGLQSKPVRTVPNKMTPSECAPFLLIDPLFSERSVLSSANGAASGAQTAEDVIRLLESTDISEEDTELLLKDAYALNRMLKSELVTQERKAQERRETKPPGPSRAVQPSAANTSGSRLPPLLKGGAGGGRSSAARLSEMRNIYGSSADTKSNSTVGTINSSCSHNRRQAGSTVNSAASRRTVSRAKTMPSTGVVEWKE